MQKSSKILENISTLFHIKDTEPVRFNSYITYNIHKTNQQWTVNGVRINSIPYIAAAIICKYVANVHLLDLTVLLIDNGNNAMNTMVIMINTYKSFHAIFT